MNPARRAVLEPLAFAVLATALYFWFGRAEQFVLTTAIIYALLTASVTILFGWGGVYTFGHAAFFGIGAYTVGLLKEQPLFPPLLLLAGGVAAAVVAVLVGLLGSRVVGIQFAILTLIVGQVLYLLTFRIEILQGDNGIFDIPLGSVSGAALDDGDNLWWYALAVVAVLLGVLRWIRSSPYGASLTAVRDDPVKAAAIGLPVRALRLSAFVLAGSVAGVAGALFAQQQSIVTPSTLSFTFSGQIIIMALLGGLYRFWGAPIGAVCFVLINDQIFGETTYATLVLGVVLLFIIVVMPRGLAGAAEWARARAVRRKAVEQ
jgi:branched-chain amino acid transport system permease protein